MKTLFVCLGVIFLLSGCAVNEVYNPLASANKGIFLINDSLLAKLKLGVKQEEVHQLMGETIVIGYAYQKPLSDEQTVSQAQPQDYQPLTIPNPYKTQELKTKEGVYIVEFYVRLVKRPDGVISDDELVPLVFQRGLLVGQGWDYLKDLRSKSIS